MDPFDAETLPLKHNRTLRESNEQLKGDTLMERHWKKKKQKKLGDEKEEEREGKKNKKRDKGKKRNEYNSP